MPVGEYDKRISLLSKEQGRITAFVRGARRPKSPLLAAGNPLSFGTFEAYRGRDSYTISKSDIDNYFDSLRTDIDGIWYASYFLEVADYYGREGVDETERLKLLYMALRALEKKKIDAGLVKLVYELKTMTINGDEPNVFQCLSCGVQEDINFFSMNHRGCVCRNCYEKDGGEALKDSVLYAMQFIISTPPEKLFSFTLGEDAYNQLKDLITRYRRRYMEHLFKSERFLEN
ncbi:MAG: DNA repair protein RecO [Lachnospiraceae bacterium]|nr:DNA repair protein RecO [Lachnospiraceae bacterium]